MARLPIPNHEKVRRGTARADRGHFDQTAHLDPLDTNLTLSLSEMFEQTVGEADWLAASDGPLVEVTREALASYRRLEDAGEVKQADAVRREIAGLFSKLGFSPVDRNRLGLGTVPRPGVESPFDEMRRKSAERVANFKMDRASDTEGD